MAGDPYLAAVGADQRGQDLNRGGLAGSVGAEQREDRSLSNVQIDAIKHNLVAERLAQPSGRDRRRESGSSHASEHAERQIYRGFIAVSEPRSPATPPEVVCRGP